MATIVKIAGKGVSLKFPDGMSKEQIAQAVKTTLPSALQPPANTAGNPWYHNPIKPPVAQPKNSFQDQMRAGLDAKAAQFEKTGNIIEPIIPPEIAKAPLTNLSQRAEDWLNSGPQSPSTAAKVGRGVLRAGAQGVDALSTPENIGMLAMGGLVPKIGTALGITYLPQMVKGTVESAVGGAKDLAAGKTEEAAQKLANAALTGTFAYLTGKQGLKGFQQAKNAPLGAEMYNNPNAPQVTDPKFLLTAKAGEQNLRPGVREYVPSEAPKAYTTADVNALKSETFEPRKIIVRNKLASKSQVTTPALTKTVIDPRNLPRTAAPIPERFRIPDQQIDAFPELPQQARPQQPTGFTAEQIKLRNASEYPSSFSATPEGQPLPQKPIVAPTPIAGTPIRPTASGQIASTGLDTGKRIDVTNPERIAFRPDKINAPDDVINLIQDTAQKNNQFQAQRISKTDAGIRDLADLVDLTPDELMKAKPGSIANAETVFKSRQVVTSLADDLRNTLKSVDPATATPEQLAAVKEKLFKLQGTMKTVAGFRTEASNVFRQFKMSANSAENSIMRDLVGQLKQIDANAADDVAAFTRGAKELLEPTFGDKAWHLWYASILSGPSTHAKNFIGNSAQMVGEISRTALTNPAEFPSAVKGLFHGLKNGFGEAKRVFKEGDINKFEQQGLKPIKFTGLARPLNAFEYVGRSLSAVDAFFREGYRGMEMRPLARQIAKAEGLTGKAMRMRMDEIVQNPTPEILAQADAFGARGTFTQKPDGVIGAIAEGIGSATNKVPPLRLIVPFTRVVANVVNNSLDWSPVGVLRAASKKFSPTPRAAYQNLGRGVIGTVGMTYLASLASEGKLTGNGPVDYRKKEQLLASGWRPNSIKIGDKFIPFTHFFGPFSIPAAIVGNYFDSVRYGDIDENDATDRLAAALLGSANSITEMSFLDGIAQLTEAVTNWQTRGPGFLKNWIANQATSPVPNAYKQVSRYFDPTVYDTQTIFEKMQSSVRATSNLNAKVDVFGDPVKGDALTELQTSKQDPNSLKSYLAQNKLWISVPSKNTLIYDRKIQGKREMTRDEYYRYVKESGQRIKQRLDASLSQIKTMKDYSAKQKYIRRVVKLERDYVKRKIAMGGL
ncbi:hypothetical protein [Caudoviricetes sp.]|nr:hypothetical protein [Caudoviricetes sp.]